MTSQKDIAIKVTEVSKSFRLPHEKQSSIKGLFLNMFKGKRTYEKQNVLNRIDFEIKKGEFFGIVGRNGSGKSTLLKLLAGIYSPDTGHIQVNGKLTPFIELGVGFNPELTGRENVYLNGALLGFNRKEMEAMYDEIVRFAELEKFMDQKLKNYSSGMQVRLAFSIAIRAKSDILLIDEVLAVGDAAFQRKCFKYFDKLKKENRTIIFVSHDMDSVRRYCSRALLLNNGEQVMLAEPEKITNEYILLNQEKSTFSGAVISGSSPISLELSGKDDFTYKTGETLKVKIKWQAGLQPKDIGLAIMKKSGEYIYGSNTKNLKLNLKDGKLTNTIKLSVGPGDYYLVAGIFGFSSGKDDQYIYQGPDFTVKAGKNSTEEGIARLDSKWD